MILSIIIPIHNEEKTLGEIVTRTQKVFARELENDYEIILVNDGSTDKTAKILSKIKDPRIQIIHHQTNSGKGKAIQSGLEKATGDYIAIQDADLEYNPVNLYELSVRALSSHSTSYVVYGKRDGKDGYILNRIGNKILSFICNVLYRSKMSDIYTCYKIIPRELMQTLNLKSNGFEIEAEITAKILKKKIDILEIPIPYTPRSFSDGKHIRWRDGYKGIMKLIEIKVHREGFEPS